MYRHKKPRFFYSQVSKSRRILLVTIKKDTVTNIKIQFNLR
ncbi:hypothetical protein ENHAE0001_0713 [Enhydrobacter aerosaccus SK60]|nr:hypothetical protein ENHAE0001_0713 [Enhydrobacter aerosaccus SK60]